MRRGSVIGLIAALAVAIVVLRPWAVALREPAAAAPAASPAQPQATPLQTLPLPESVPKPVPPAAVREHVAPPPPLPPLAPLLAQAQSGDIVAAERLGVRLLACDEESLAFSRARLASLQRSESSAEELRQRIADCEALPPDERGRAFDWIEKAARAGGYDERRTFYENALPFSMYGAQNIAANIDEIERRRDLAREFMRADIAACKPDIFAVQRQATLLLGIADRIEQLAVIYAELLMRERPAGTPRDAPIEEDRQFRALSAGVDAADVEAARRRGAAMMAHCAP